MASAITVYRSRNKRGKYGGAYKARWRENGSTVTWNTGAYDEAAARKAAAAERNRRGSLASRPPEEPAPDLGSCTQDPAPVSVSAPASPRLPDADVAAALALAAPAPESMPPIPAPGAAPTDAGEKLSRLHGLFGRGVALAIDGGLQRLVRWAGREPAEMDDDEKRLIEDGGAELGRIWFGDVHLGPWGKVALGTTAAGIGMYLGGRKIEKPKKDDAVPEPIAES